MRNLPKTAGLAAFLMLVSVTSWAQSWTQEIPTFVRSFSLTGTGVETYRFTYDGPTGTAQPVRFVYRGQGGPPGYFCSNEPTPHYNYVMNIRDLKSGVVTALAWQYVIPTDITFENDDELAPFELRSDRRYELMIWIYLIPPPDCQAYTYPGPVRIDSAELQMGTLVPVDPSTWGGVKALYR